MRISAAVHMTLICLRDEVLGSLSHFFIKVHMENSQILIQDKDTGGGYLLDTWH